MDIKIEAQLNSLKLTSSAPASKEWEEKFLLKENHAKILAWCKDHHVRAYWDSINKKSELVQVLTEANCNSFGLLDKLHTEFMLFVGKLQSNEQLQSSEHCLEKSEVSKDDKKFVKTVLRNWDETEKRLGVAGAILIGEDSRSRTIDPIGHINKSVLRQMFEAWLEKYDT